jgi:DNA modification methylase
MKTETDIQMQTIKPYYETDFGVLYHGDCLEIIPHLDPVELVLTDPLYPNMKGGVVHMSGGVAQHYSESKTVGGSYQATLDWIPLAWDKLTKAMMIFCSYHFVSDISKHINGDLINLLTWHKRNAPNPVCNRPKYTTEFIWLFQKAPGLKWRNLKTSMFDIPNLTAGCVSTGERITNKDGKAAHPMQKPLSLITELLGVGGDPVMDCHMGSGTTAVACEQIGRRWIGIEISEKYCEIAAKRIEKEREQLKLFPVEAELPKPKQSQIF